MLSGESRDLNFMQVMDALMHAMRVVVQRNAWSTVFAQNGFGNRFEATAIAGPMAADVAAAETSAADDEFPARARCCH